MARTPTSEYQPYEPHAPAFTVCTCGVLVSENLWVHGTKETPAHWRKLPEAVTAALGLPHACETGMLLQPEAARFAA